MKARSLLTLWMVVMAAPLMLARSIHVPDEAPSIQAGLDSLQDGDTVLVALGTYAEALIAPPLHFVLRGDVIPDTGDYSRPVIDPTVLPGSDSLTCLTLPAGSHPVVEDLVFRNGLAMYPHNINDGGIMSWASDPIFRRIVMDSVIYAFRDYSGNAIITLDSCRFQFISQSGIEAPGCAVNATNCLFSQNQAVLLGFGSRSVIMGCRFEAAQSPADYMLIIGGLAPGGGRVDNCVFTSSQPVLGISMSVYYGGIGVGLPVEISNNIFTGLAGFGPPVHVQYNFPHFPTVDMHDNLFLENSASCVGCAGAIQFEQAWSFDEGTLSTITNNIISNCTGWASGSSAIYACAGADLAGNRFFHLSPYNAPAVHMAYDIIESNLTMRDNLFFDTGMALRNDQLNTPVDARWNWWGDSTGPYHTTLNPNGQGDTIVGNVDFTPWYPDTSFLEEARRIQAPLPERFQLEAYPNPFNSTVTLKLIPNEVMIIRVELFDILGRRVKELWSGPIAYEKRITFDGSNLSSGIYFVRVWQPIGNRPLALTKLVLLK